MPVRLFDFLKQVGILVSQASTLHDCLGFSRPVAILNQHRIGDGTVLILPLDVLTAVAGVVIHQGQLVAGQLAVAPDVSAVDMEPTKLVVTGPLVVVNHVVADGEVRRAFVQI